MASYSARLSFVGIDYSPSAVFPAFMLRMPLSDGLFFSALVTSSFPLCGKPTNYRLSSSLDVVREQLRPICGWSSHCAQMTWKNPASRGDHLAEAVSVTWYHFCGLCNDMVVCALMTSAVLVERHKGTLNLHSHATKQRLSCSTWRFAVMIDWIVVALCSARLGSLPCILCLVA